MGPDPVQLLYVIGIFIADGPYLIHVFLLGGKNNGWMGPGWVFGQELIIGPGEYYVLKGRSAVSCAILVVYTQIAHGHAQEWCKGSDGRVHNQGAKTPHDATPNVSQM